MPGRQLQNGDGGAEHALVVRRIGVQGLHGSLAIFPTSADGLRDLVAYRWAHQTGFRKGKEKPPEN